MDKGKFIVIEGTDGSGKGTQFKLLKKRLEEEGYKVIVFDFPQYGTPGAYFVEQYLNGIYGGIDEVGPYKGSIFYAIDRFSAAPEITKALDEGKIVLCNRFTASNLGHQGSKMDSQEERKKYYTWATELEFKTLSIPEPDKNIILHVDAGAAQKLVDLKTRRDYIGDKKRDIHEDNLEHLQKSEKVYKELTEVYPEKYVLIECMDGEKILSKGEVQEKVWALVKTLI